MGWGLIPDNYLDYPLNAGRCQAKKSGGSFTQPIAQVRIHKIVQATVQHSLRVAAFVFGAVVFDQLIGMQHI